MRLTQFASGVRGVRPEEVEVKEAGLIKSVLIDFFEVNKRCHAPNGNAMLQAPALTRLWLRTQCQKR